MSETTYIKHLTTPRSEKSEEKEFNPLSFSPCSYDEMIYLVEFLKSLKFFANKNPSDITEIALSLLLETFDDDEMVFD